MEVFSAKFSWEFHDMFGWVAHRLPLKTPISTTISVRPSRSCAFFLSTFQRVFVFAAGRRLCWCSLIQHRCKRLLKISCGRETAALFVHVPCSNDSIWLMDFQPVLRIHLLAINGLRHHPSPDKGHGSLLPLATLIGKGIDRCPARCARNRGGHCWNHSVALQMEKYQKWTEFVSNSSITWDCLQKNPMTYRHVCHLKKMQ